MMDALKGYIENIRPHFDKGRKSDYLFLSGRGKQFYYTTVRERMYYYAKRAVITYRSIHPHALRATFATRLSRYTGADITVIRELMGHTNISTTARYVGVVEEDKRRAVEGLQLYF